MDHLTSYFVVALHEDALLAFHVGEEIPGFLAGKWLRNLRDLSHTALYFGAELSVVVDPAFHAGKDTQFACEWELQEKNIKIPQVNIKVQCKQLFK